MEHLSYLLTGIITTKKESSHEIFEIYVLKMFPQVFNVITYNTWIAVLVLVINSVSTLTLCFSDQLIIMGSIALGNYFQSFNDRMKMYKGKVRIIYIIILYYRLVRELPLLFMVLLIFDYFSNMWCTYDVYSPQGGIKRMARVDFFFKKFLNPIKMGIYSSI